MSVDDSVVLLMTIIMVLMILLVSFIGAETFMLVDIKTEVQNLNVQDYIIEQERIKMILTPEQRELLNYEQDK